MSLIIKKNSPDWIRNESATLTEEDAKKQSIRPLRIGIINYMPDAALQATEQDFLRPLLEASGSHQFETTFFSPLSVPRSEKTQEYIVNHYTNITREALAQCDILIHTGANDLDTNGDGINFLETEKGNAVAQEMIANYRLAEDAGVTVQVGSCLASQVIAHNEYNIPLISNAKRDKLTGIFEHEVSEYGEENHLTKDLNDSFNVVYSRNHSLLTSEIESHPELESLIQTSEEINGQKETHLFIDPKKLFFGFQGHPEYQKGAIYKEFLRDVGLHFKNPEKYKKFPNIPPNYFSQKGLEKVEKFKEATDLAVKNKLEKKKSKRPMLELDIKKDINQSWRDTADKIWARIFNAAYQITGEKAGQKITTKREISEYNYPLDALV